MKKGKFLSIALAMLLALTTLFAACDCKNNEGPEGGNTGKQGIHGGTVEETNDYIVKNGKSDYVVVYDKESTDTFIPTAKNAFINFFREATKVVLPEKDDSEVSASNDLKAIVIGQNAISQAAGLTNEYYSKSEQSFQIKTVGKTIYVLGAKYGVVYGAYELLNYLFGFKYYTEYCYDLDKGVTDEKLCNYNISEVPDLNDITMNVLGLVTTTQDPYYKNGIRLTNRGSFGWGGGVHNSYDNVPPTKDLVINKGLINPFTNKEFDPENGYLEDHRHWYSPEVGGFHGGLPRQLCFSAQDEFYDVVFQKMRYMVATNKTDSNIIAFSFEDNPQMCGCDKCKAAKNKYGAESALLMKFCSRLAKDLNDWLATDEAKEWTDRTNVKVTTLAYHATFEAPVILNEATGKYEVTAPEIAMDEDLLVQYCTRNADRFSSLNSSANASYRDNFKAWADVTEQMSIWKYNQAWYGERLQWNGYFSCMQEDYKFMFECGVSQVMDEGQASGTCFTAFQNLRGFLAGNLHWDCNQDYQALIDSYFNRCFGPAAEEMRFIFDSLEANLQTKYLAGKIRGIEHHLMTTANYEKGFLEYLLEVGEAALEKIKPLAETNRDEYARMEVRISNELLSLRYMYIELYSNKLAADEALQLKLFYKKETTRLGMTSGGWTLNGEDGSLQKMYERWGIA